MSHLALPSHSALEAAGRPRCAFIIDPRTSRHLGVWDTLTAISLVVTAALTPYEAAFLSPGIVWLFWLNRLIDMLFAVDIVVQFFTMYPKDTRGSEPTGAQKEGSFWVSDPWQIARHYLTGWFCIDVASTSVCAFDIIAFIDVDAGSDYVRVKVLRVMRVLRLAKLLRLLRGMRLLQRWETRLSIDYSAVTILSSFVLVCAVAHWSACLWAAIVAFADRLEDTWLHNLGYCVERSSLTDQASLEKFSSDPPGDDASVYACLPHRSLYAASLYFAIMTITSIGYGDISATPQVPLEQLTVAVLMLIGGFTWAFVVGSVVEVLSTLSPQRTDFKLTLSALNQYIRVNALPASMAQRLRDYFFRSRYLWETNSAVKVLKKMSPTLKAEVLLHVNSVWVAKVPWLVNEDNSFLTDVILSLEPVVFAPEETVRGASFFVLFSGLAVFRGTIKRRGDVWGTDILITKSYLRSRTFARAMTYLEVFSIERDVLFIIAARHPDSLHRLRRAGHMLALRTFVKLVGRARRHQMASHQDTETESKTPYQRWKKALFVHKSQTHFATTFQLHEEETNDSHSFGGKRHKLRTADRVEQGHEKELAKMLYRVISDAPVDGSAVEPSEASSTVPVEPSTFAPPNAPSSGQEGVDNNLPAHKERRGDSGIVMARDDEVGRNAERISWGPWWWSSAPGEHPQHTGAEQGQRALDERLKALESAMATHQVETSKRLQNLQADLSAHMARNQEEILMQLRKLTSKTKTVDLEPQANEASGASTLQA